jgi:hypothetical protein
LGPTDKERPLVLSAAEVELFDQFDYIGPGGEELTIDPESVNGTLILFPEDFGNLSSI